MRLQKGIILVLLSLMFLSACTSNDAKQPESTVTPLATSVATPAITPKPTEVVEEISQLSKEQQAIVSALEEALENAKVTNNLQFYSSSQSQWYSKSYDGLDTPLLDLYYSNYFGNVQRDTGNGLVEIYSSQTTYDITDEYNHVLIDDFEIVYDYYLSKDLGLFYSERDENNWFNGDLPDDFKTVGHLEELILFFLQYPEFITINEFIIEGDTPEDGEYRELILNLPTEELVSNYSLFSENFFTGTFANEYEDQTFYFVSPELNYYYLSLTLDDKNRISSFFLDLETTQLESDDKYLVTDSMYFSYDDSVDIPVITIPKEVIRIAAENE